MFVDSDLRHQFWRLALRPRNGQPRGPVAKRRKLEEEEPSLLLEVASQLCRSVDASPSSEIEELESRIMFVYPWLTDCINPDPLHSDRFPQMDEERQCHLIDLISRIVCAADSTLRLKRTKPQVPSVLQCPFCSASSPNNLPLPNRHEAAKSLGIGIYSKVIRLPSFLESRKPRVTAMIALRRIARHSTDGDLWDLEKPGPGQWCLQSLQSSIRELRIAAGRALSVFISEPPTAGFDCEVLKRNRSNALGILKSLSDKEAPNLHETCIMAWGQVGRVVSAEELNLVVIKLVEYLGHRSMLVSGFAFNEVLNLADFRGESVAQLFQPFWPSLAFSVVKDLVSKPQTARLVADLMQMGVSDLLRMLQKHALPWLVLTKKRDVVQKCAEALGWKETWQLCTDPANLPSILHLLLVQDAPDVAGHAMSLLVHVSSHFDRFEFVELLRTDPLTVALELFKAGAEANEARKVKVCEVAKYRREGRGDGLRQV
jgi:serine/threonine-protein kinase ATR